MLAACYMKFLASVLVAVYDDGGQKYPSSAVNM